MTTEIRSFQFELRAASDFSLVGYAAKFNSPSKPIPAGGCGEFTEVIAPGAFTRVLADPETDVRCLFNHDVNRILGRTASGTLTLKQDAVGLSFRCQLDRANTEHSNIYSSVRRGDLNDCSFGFTTDDDTWTVEGGKNVRRIRSFSGLFDVSVVANPAYPGTTVAARAALPRIALNEDALLRARAAKQAADIALTNRMSPLEAMAIRSGCGMTVERLADAMNRLRAKELAKELS